MTVAVALLRPPGPVQERVKALVVVSGPVWKVPLRFCGPVQPPDAEQLVAFVVLQFNAAVLPAVIREGTGVSDMLGPGSVTIIFTVA